ncbi:MAG: hypothetical protein GWN99_00250 [Gemmatimonadetes bacterium]|uniref:Lipocalin-like domain-containing protein n=1 Tax=Candidatus Kutchimonas denitrificans TaxID=3056748 RepID=A0AAE4Z4T6_9BACT|nr:hypothetical protein [Gemmatimonadota bacterium]NIR73538.1 hypothetical protein [Candidatus Kutchimonas denitrificans]NIR99497.1 hypothetical protein [Gemmatimonadota bacterium]NIT65117.1 hypothetical protein [Gemmatimonadota bacterium]NIV23650.1 hypothetical protein [Gemmatimonadota bacterium]
MIITIWKRRLIVLCAALGPTAAACGDGGPLDVSGRWQAVRIEWTQNDQPVTLTVDGELQMGRFKLPTRPASFEPMIAAMGHVTIEVNQNVRELSGRVHADAEAPGPVLSQVGARPGSVVAEFSGRLVNDTLGTVTVVTPDGRQREIVLVIEADGDRVVARAVPVFGEADADAGDVVLERAQRM